MPKDKTLKDFLEDWVDIDGVMRKLGQHIGIFEEKEPGVGLGPSYKKFFWSANPVGDALGSMLEELRKIGALEFNDEEIQYRWNKNFDVEKAYKGEEK